jgi:hypothetical protein
MRIGDFMYCILRVCSQLCFLLAILLFYWLLFRPLLTTLDATMKRSRAMLLLLPDVVIDGVDDVRTDVRKLINTAAP